MLELVIIGAGPAGISAAYEAKKAGLDYVVIEKGLIANTVYNYPVGLTVFSTTNELEFEKGDLKPAREKPTREELLSYYVRFVLDNELNIQTEEEVKSVTRNSPPCLGGVAIPMSSIGIDGVVVQTESDNGPMGKQENLSELPPRPGSPGTPPKQGGELFVVTTDKGEYLAKNVLFAIGAMDYPRKLNVPGEDLPKVQNHFRETYPWVKKKALIVGGGNSAGEAALFLAQEGAETTLAIFREDWENTDPKQGCIKYWVKEPLEEELKEHCLKLFFLGKIIEIREKEVELENDKGETVILENDVVFVLIGADADLTMLKSLGVETEQGKHGEVPIYSVKSFETNVAGVYVAGHFTNHRHIRPAIEAGRHVVRDIVKKKNRREAASS